MTDAPTRSVTLPAEIARSVDAAVASGDYASPEEAIGEAVREWTERRENWGYTIAELRAEIQKGIDSGPAEPFTMQDVKAYARRWRKLRDAAE